MSINAGPLSANNASEDPTINAAIIIAVVKCFDISFIPSTFIFSVISPSSNFDKVLFTVVGNPFVKCPSSNI